MAFAAINSAGMPIIAIEEAFATEPSLKKRVYDAIGTTPQHAPLFEDLARYTCSLLARTANTASLPIVPPPSDGPAAKKRKIQNGEPGVTAQAPVDVKGDASAQFYVQDISFAVPQRKKLTLEVTAGSRYLRARNQATKEIEFGVPMDRIRHALCLPVPEKTQKQFNFCILPEYADGITPPPEGVTAFEAMVFTVADGPAKAAFTGSGQQIGNNAGETAEGLIRKILNDNLTTTSVVRPDERQFVSAMPEAHRKSEKAYHIKAFRGSKEGYLFLLSSGILFAFKKPLLFFSFDTIESVSYTSVLQRTFNLNILARPSGGTEDDTQEIEFSMIDQADFSGIDTYIKRHGLQDASLAEARRAKKYNVNGGNKTEDGAAAAEGAGVEEESELQKAQQELEDLEDEDEEDYDPGSDDGSDGSGSSSDEDSDEDEFHEDADQVSDGDEEDLVQQELGSEAEDVADDE
ncbi:Histone chaperone [Penicillium canariense]|uniref:Histone chaperone n=1 Tax=Penicillium canariense TaxID=189055 RepID=A0A9W9LIH4_9EURO|nr:Histone chaperone [Penicillium canariense]KAJ5157484.1 Histone chaperone [Penicillium canariense]